MLVALPIKENGTLSLQFTNNGYEEPFNYHKLIMILVFVVIGGLLVTILAVGVITLFVVLTSRRDMLFNRHRV